MTQSSETPSPVPSASFSPPSQAGVLMGWSMHQVVVGSVGLLMIVAAMPMGRNLLDWANLPWAALTVASMVTVRGRSLWQLLMVRLGFALRRATGRTKWTVSPMAVDTTVGLVDLPGATGQRLRPWPVIDTEFGGAAFILDQASGEATAVIVTDARAWIFAPDRDKAGRAEAWSRVMREVMDMKGVKRVVTQARTLAVPHVPEPARRDDATMRDIREVEGSRLVAETRHDLVVSLTVDTGAVEDEIHAAGGGRAGVSQVLKERVCRLASLLPGTGTLNDRTMWADWAILRGMMKTMTDPSAWGLLNDLGQLPDDVPVSTSWIEYADRIRVDRMWAKTLWVDTWPSDRVMAGWLEPVTAQNRLQLVLTQAWRPKPESKAVKDLDTRMAELDRIIALSNRVKRPVDPKVLAEREEVLARRRQAAKDQGDVAFQGFLTVISPSKDQLHTDLARLRSTVGDGVHLDDLTAQQWAGWLAALPLGQAGR